MTYQSNYTLADKMQKQFRGRGQNISGMHASSTSELKRRAEMGRDPRVNCAEQAFRENYRNQRSQSGRNHTGASANRTTESARRQREESRARNAFVQARSYERAYAEKPEEIRVKQSSISPMFLAMLLIGTLMVLFLVFSISEIYQTTSQISKLEDELAMLQSEAEALRLQLEEKNDIRNIEEIATAELGMVKEDSVQRRYVSLSEGEYIELVATEEKDEGASGLMLSSIFASLGDFLGRFK